MNRRTVCQLALLPFVLPLLGCGRRDDGYQPSFSADSKAGQQLSFAVHPLHNPAMLHATYGPLVAYLNAVSSGPKFRLIASRDYRSFERRLAAREFDFALPNPYQAVTAAASGYRIFGKMAGDENFRGLILTRRDSPVRAIGDLRGRTISYSAPTAVAATMLPQLFLHRNGVPLNATRTVYVGSMESAIRSLVIGASDAAAVWPDPWEKFSRTHSEAARALEVRWRTPHLVNNALVAREDIAPTLSERVLIALRRLDGSGAGRRLLETLAVAGFEGADERTYDPVRGFLSEFSRAVRPLDLPAELAA